MLVLVFINLLAMLSVVNLTICILHCDKVFYNYTRKIDFNIEPAITFFLKMLSSFLVCCIHLNSLQTRFFHGSDITHEQPNLGPYCLQYTSKLHNKINSKLHKNINRLGPYITERLLLGRKESNQTNKQQTRKAEQRRLNNGSLEKN